MAATKIWVMSDAHLFHLLVSTLRGYTVEEFTKIFVDDWMSKVRPKDQVWLLGDLTGGGYVDMTFSLLESLPGEKHLIIGNHDSCFPGHRDSHRAMQKYYRVFTSVQLHARRSINGTKVMVSHFPYSGDHTDGERHNQWRLPDYGVPIIHGHTHSSDILSVSTKGTPQINVAWEATKGLVTFDSLYAYLP